MYNYKLGETVNIVRLPNIYPKLLGGSLHNAVGIIKQIAKTGKIMVMVNKWNYWFSPEDISPRLDIRPELNLDSKYNEKLQNFEKGIKELINAGDKTPKFVSGSTVTCKQDGVKYVIQTHLKEYKNNKLLGIHYFVLIEGHTEQKVQIFPEEMLTDKPPTKKYRKRPIVVEAYQTDKEMIINTLEGDMKAEVGDWIVIGVKGEEYPVKPDIFDTCYEAEETTMGLAMKKLKVGDVVIMLSNRETDIVEHDNDFFDPTNGWQFRLKSGRVKGERELMLLTEYDEKKTLQPSSPYPKAKFQEGEMVELPTHEPHYMKNKEGLVEHRYYGNDGWIYDVKVFDELKQKFDNYMLDEYIISKLT